MPKTVGPEDARQGRWGWQVLVVLAVALLLAMGAWYGAEIFGQSTETPRTQNEPGALPETQRAEPGAASAPASQ